MQITIEIHRSEDNIEYKTFSVHPSDLSHKSYGYLVGYCEALTEQGITTRFVDQNDEVAPKPPNESAAPWEEFINIPN